MLLLLLFLSPLPCHVRELLVLQTAMKLARGSDEEYKSHLRRLALERLAEDNTKGGFFFGYTVYYSFLYAVFNPYYPFLYAVFNP